ncbi:MAG: molybdopterin-dependent oxidoreductase [bacterium]|nr:molybdopterin-dependent oxidoreductase [bacterium]
MKNIDTPIHARGESVFLDDIQEPEGLLHAAVFTSPSAHGKIKRLDIQKAGELPGVYHIMTFRDITGENQIGAIIQDESLLAEDIVHFIGEPIALVLAYSRKTAHEACELIEVEIEPLPVITDPREAYEQGKLVIPERTFLLGDPDSARANCDVVVEGRADSAGQEHFYMETQGAMAVPIENDAVKIYSSTQSPTGVQRIASRVLGLPMHKIEVEIRRLGGGFGGKEDQATPWAVLVAQAAFNLKVPVKLTLNRHQDIAITGKRHPYSSDFKLGLDSEGKILTYEVKYFQNAGAAADLSTAILERTLFHSTNSYFIPNVKAVAASCYTNLTPFTAYRGFGGPQAMFVMEAAIVKAAEELNITPAEIQQKNLLQENDTLPYGMQVENCRAERCRKEADEAYDIGDIFQKVRDFNAANRLVKKGAAVMPICFGISFTNTMLNQAGALVHVYNDGSVRVSTGAVEMGQGVNMKILEIVARTFGIPSERVIMDTTSTARVANTSPTAASTGADMNGKAAEIAALAIRERLLKKAAQMMAMEGTDEISIIEGHVAVRGYQTALTWEQLVLDAYLGRTNLSAQGYFATPGIFFDKDKEKGKPFAYHVFGTAVTEVTLDCLRGTYDIDAVHIVHDAGKSIDVLIDRGQVEGALLQGIGWVTVEELTYSAEGVLQTDSSSTYKVPDLKSVPATVDVRFLDHASNPKAVIGSKAIGEPPFMYGISAYYAVMEAMKAYRPEKKAVFNSPITPEKVMGFLYDEVE